VECVEMLGSLEGSSGILWNYTFQSDSHPSRGNNRIAKRSRAIRCT
jgi:hypothetical protein